MTESNDNIINSSSSSKEMIVELIKNQKKDTPVDKKLLFNDLKRASKYLTTSIFDDECSIWNGYITVIKNDDKNSYINFYFNGKKYALHRLLYVNYIGELLDSEYIKFKCANKGKCCNINHFYKINNEEKEPKVDSSPVLKPFIKNQEPIKNIIVNFGSI